MMATTAEKLIYLNETKTAIKEAIEAQGVEVADDATFRSYADRIAEIESGLPQQEKTIEITENGSYEVVPDEGYAISKVTATVGITIPEPVVEALEIVENGTYTVPEGVDGYNPITVNVPTGGGGIPEEAFHISGDCKYKFSSTGWTWFIELYGNQITTSDITNALYMFQNNTTVKTIPFVLNLSAKTNLSSIFSGCSELTAAPAIRGELTPLTGSSSSFSMDKMFGECYRIREIPYDYFNNFGGEAFWEANIGKCSGNRESLFSNCYSLREAPDLSVLPNNARYYASLQNSCFRGCQVLDEVLNFPVGSDDGTYAKYTSNSFTSTVSRCYRLKNFTFATQEDGTPYTRSYKSQTLDFSDQVGYVNMYDRNNVTINYNSGISLDKEVTDDATYQALKDDPDWFTLDIAYSRYNHDSAVATINSLPDTSAYLATAGGTNTIKFKGASGELTDGGAINTLTEEEIAVATAKGWTVTLV